MADETRSSLSEVELNYRKKAILKSYLRQFLVPPLDPATYDFVTQFFVSHRSDLVLSVQTPTEAFMKQVAQCLLLSYGRKVNWFSCSSHELVRSFFDSNSALFDLFGFELVVIYHGFDSLPNKLTWDHVNQVAFSRSSRNLHTVVLSKDVDSGINYPILTLQRRSGSACAQTPQPEGVVTGVQYKPSEII